VKRSAEAIRFGARFDEVHLIGQAIKHHLAWPRVREHRVPLREGEIRGLARPGFSKKDWLAALQIAALCQVPDLGNGNVRRIGESEFFQGLGKCASLTRRATVLGSLSPTSTPSSAAR
jgi:hypothetical protein